VPLLGRVGVTGDNLTSVGLCLVKFLFMNQLNEVIALRSIVPLVDASHLVPSATVIGRKAVDHQVALLVSPRLKVNNGLGRLCSCVHGRKVPGSAPVTNALRGLHMDESLKMAARESDQQTIDQITQLLFAADTDLTDQELAEAIDLVGLVERPRVKSNKPLPWW
jgi:hypothetical protein